MDNGDLDKLTFGEVQLIKRRRLGQSMTEAGANIGLNRNQYAKLELMDDIQSQIALLAPERCLIYRRRAGSTQSEIAEELGVSRFWVNQMERGAVPCDMLVGYWEQ